MKKNIETNQKTLIPDIDVFHLAPKVAISHSSKDGMKSITVTGKTVQAFQIILNTINTLNKNPSIP